MSDADDEDPPQQAVSGSSATGKKHKEAAII